MTQAQAEAIDMAPPITSRGAVGWLRHNLFNTWYNSVLTLVAVYLLYKLFSGMLRWAFINAIWVGTAQDCHRGTGACWALITEKYRFMLFATYPWEQQWRPALVIALFIVMVVISTWRRLWSRQLLTAWGIVFIIMAWLVRGGLGLPLVDTQFWGGLLLTLMLSVLGILFAFPLAILLALGRRSHMPVVRSVSVTYIELIRGVPLITVLFMATVMFPLFLPPGLNINNVLCAQVGIILFGAAYLAEVVRGGLQAVPKGQFEAADALGLSYWQKVRLIVMPQALRVVIPPLVNSFISTFKDTSLVAIVGLFDLLGSTKIATADPVWRSFSIEAYIFAALIYFTFCFFMSKYSQHLEATQAGGKRR